MVRQHEYILLTQDENSVNEESIENTQKPKKIKLCLDWVSTILL